MVTDKVFGSALVALGIHGELVIVALSRDWDDRQHAIEPMVEYVCELTMDANSLSSGVYLLSGTASLVDDVCNKFDGTLSKQGVLPAGDTLLEIDHEL